MNYEKCNKNEYDWEVLFNSRMNKREQEVIQFMIKTNSKSKIKHQPIKFKKIYENY